MYCTVVIEIKLFSVTMGYVVLVLLNYTGKSSGRTIHIELYRVFGSGIYEIDVLTFFFYGYAMT